MIPPRPQPGAAAPFRLRGVRVAKIAAMIAECDWGVHDLSRVEVTRGNLPRFNMPMELGLHLGARLIGESRHRRKKALILEAKRHRYHGIGNTIVYWRPYGLSDS
jgi:hypothetical protein